MMWCHHKWSEVKDGYQYCSKCGKARVVKCSHDLKLLTTKESISRGYDGTECRVTGICYHLQCSKCGDIIQRKMVA